MYSKSKKKNSNPAPKRKKLVPKKKTGGNYHEQSSILMLVMPFIIITTLIIIMLFRKVKCPIRDIMDMSAEELPSDQLVLIAANDLKSKSLVTQSGIANTIVTSDDLSQDVVVLATAGEVCDGTCLMVKMTENVWDTVPFSKTYVNEPWIPVNDSYMSVSSCLDREWSKTVKATNIGKCYESALDIFG
jgi:hypothetical protein